MVAWLWYLVAFLLGSGLIWLLANIWLDPEPLDGPARDGEAQS